MFQPSCNYFFLCVKHVVACGSSESVYRAYKNIDTLKNDSSFKPWILRIVHNTAVEMIRKNENITPVDELPEKASWKEEEDTVSRLTLREAVESLKSPYDTVVILFYYENLKLLLLEI